MVDRPNQLLHVLVEAMRAERKDPTSIGTKGCLMKGSTTRTRAPYMVHSASSHLAVWVTQADWISLWQVFGSQHLDEQLPYAKGGADAQPATTLLRHQTER